MGDTTEAWRARIGKFTPPASWRNVVISVEKYDEGGNYEPRDTCVSLLCFVAVFAYMVYGANALLWSADQFLPAMDSIYGIDTQSVDRITMQLKNPCGYPYIPRLLELGNDVEKNPGPATRSNQSDPATVTQMEELKSMVQEVLQWSKSVDQKLLSFGNRIRDVEGTVENLKEQTLDTAEKVKRIDNIKSDLDSERSRINSLEDEVRKLNTRADESEDRTRRNNLMFCGIEGSPNETWEESEKKVRDFVKDKLSTHVGTGFERVHRIPNGPKTNGCAPIIAAFTSYKDKDRVLHQSFRLKDTMFYLREDFSAGTRRIRKLLLEKKKELGQNVKKANLRHRKLVVTEKSGLRKTFVVNDQDKVVRLDK